MTTLPEVTATQALIDDLRGAMTEVYFDHMTRLLYSTEASIYQMMPIGVAIPRDADEVAAAVEIAGRHGVPVLPRGGGSSLAGQTVNHALVLDLSNHMDQIIEVDTEAQTVRTQPGITFGVMNKRLAKHGLMFGPDPASGERATMGGILGNNSTGAHSIVYGMTVDHVLAANVVLSDASKVHFDALDGDSWEVRGKRPGLEGAIYRAMPGILEQYTGQIVNRYPKVWRHVAGYNLNQLVQVDSPNLAKLMVGSEGTLGIITEATLNLVKAPKHKRLALVHFSDLRESLEAVPVMLESGPSAIELLDKFMLDLTRDKVEYQRLLTFVEGDPAIVLIVEYASDDPSDLDRGVEALKARLTRLKHRDPVVLVTDPAQQANVWFVRKVGLGILMSIRGDAKPLNFIEDAAVPVEHLADYVTQTVETCQQAGVGIVPMYAHASAGCVHIQPMVDLKTKEGVRQLREIAEASANLAISFGGTTSGEHGDGIIRAEFLERLFGPELVQAFHQVKQTFDPQGIMNPNKILDTPKMDDISLMRISPNYSTPFEISPTVYSFEADGGYARSVEMCSGAGVCRKTDQGVMCPAFMVTKDETHSTRGFANAIRSAMMGLFGEDGMTSQEVYRLVNECLSCKSCKSECPSAVDLTKIKAEYLHNYYQTNGVPLRSWVFGHIAQLNALAQPFAPLSNALLTGPGRWALTLMGVHRQRTMPKFVPQTFTAWYKQHARSNGAKPAPRDKKLVFFHDTFMQHNAPDIGKAAVKILEAAGYELIMPPDRKCCGRPLMSKGLLEEAAALARHNVEVLAPYAEQGIPIVGCEPSCIAALIDEYPDLVPTPECEAVSGHTMLIDEFLVREAEAGNLDGLRFDETPREVLLHGQCYQKALWGTANTHKLLGLLPNCTVTEVESSCCGMAGSFGYEAEHYETSMALAELSLAPAVRATPAETIIAAAGTSCREQIHHTTGRMPLHPIEVLAEALTTG